MSAEEVGNDRVAHELSTARDAAVRALTDADDPGTAMARICHRLQAIASADGAAVAINGRVYTAGNVPTESQIHQLAVWLQPQLSHHDLFVTDRLSELFPDAAAWTCRTGGVLATQLTGADPIVVMWFRREQVQGILRAGNQPAPLEPGSDLGVLSRQTSFASWKGRSHPWSVAEIDSVRAFKPRATVVLQEQKIHELNVLLRDANERLARLSATDGLTGMANRRAFAHRLHEEWARGRRIGTSVAVIVVDLDFFNQYNEHFGHEAGDACLKQIARLLQDGRRAADFAARTGGEVFSLLLPDTDLEGALAVAETTRRRIEALRIGHPNSPFGIMTASLGVASAESDGAGTADDLMRAADRALYRAKMHGRNRAAHI